MNGFNRRPIARVIATPTQHARHTPRRGNQRFRQGSFFLYPAIIIVALSILFVVKTVFLPDTIFENFGQKGFFQQVKNLVIQTVAPNVKKLQGEQEGAISIVLLGIGGAQHEGGYLADTIVLATIKPSSQRLGLLSIPRDLYVPIPGFGKRKINNAYALGELQNEEENGGEISASVISDILDVSVPYYVRFDFEAFEKIIDAIDGVDVFVERTFEDTTYPTDDFGVRTVFFEQGMNHLDGKKALEFARSRHGTNGEGSDFARAVRQQKIINATREKIQRFNTFFHVGKIKKIRKILEDHVETNLELWEIARLYERVKDVAGDHIVTRVLNDNPNGPLRPIVSQETGAYLLLPKKGEDDFSELADIQKNIFLFGERQKEKATILVQNGGGVSGLAQRAQDVLEAYDYAVANVENALRPDYERTIIYDITDGTKQNTLADLQTLLDARIASYIPPVLAEKDTDFVVIVGSEFQKSFPAPALLVSRQPQTNNNTNVQDQDAKTQMSDSETTPATQTSENADGLTSDTVTTAP